MSHLVCAQLWRNSNTFITRRLGYVSMDVLWLLSGLKMPSDISGEIWQIIAALENRDAYGEAASCLYNELLPTLGGRVVRPIIDRLQHAEEHVRRLAAALRRLRSRPPLHPVRETLVHPQERQER